ncbi:MAG: divalent-cation tolerance protein CutA, partial [Candidatus Omnitrophica bacterium]|nr:divalent-cation tolerance protein CutA [Candidatus Omnitrophota bacterium]
MNIAIFITASNMKEANKIANALVGARLVACVNILDKVKSVFFWEAKLERAQEVLLIAKSKKAKFSKIARLAKSLHSYQVPEIIALPIIDGYRPYLKW